VDSPPAPTPRPLALRPLLVLLTLVLSVLAAEGVARLIFSGRGAPYSAQATRVEIQSTISGMAGDLPLPDVPEDESPNASEGGHVLHPYTGYAVSLERDDNIAAYYSEDQPGFELVLFGGSFAAIFHDHATKLLERTLASKPAFAERELEVFKLARAGFKQPQQLTSLAYLLARGAAPDLVVNLDGYNELHLAGRNAREGERPSFPSVGHWAFLTAGNRPDEHALELITDIRLAERQAQELGERTLGDGSLRSAILGRHRLGQLHRLQLAWSNAQTELVRHLTSTGEERELERRAARRAARREDPLAGLEADVALWAESSRSMHDLCAGRGIAYLHLLQPTLHDEGSKPLTPEERHAGIDQRGIDPRIAAGYDLLRAAGAELAADGVDFVDLTQLFATTSQTLYYDRCHVNRAGNRILARELTRLIAERQER